jgi:hypothetical protein
MFSKVEPVILNGHNYGIWAQDMGTLLKSKVLSRFIETTILDLKDDQQKCIIDGKKDDTIGVITTYISREIFFHISRIDYPHHV